MIFVVAFVVSAALAFVVTPAVRVFAERAGVVDRPGPRKAHARETARLGGLAVIASAGAGAIAAAVAAPGIVGRTLWPIVAASAAIFALGVCDDVRGVSPWTKIVVETLAGALIIFNGDVIDRVTIAGTTVALGAASVPLTLIWLLTITNAFNLIDGLDGLAAGLAAIAAAACAVILVARGHAGDGVLLVALLGAAVGFLPHNFHPASIFLGDSGSLVIGFVLAATAVRGAQKGATALAIGVPLLIFAVPIVDTVSSVVRRIGRAPDAEARRPGPPLLQRIVAPDRDHIHHRLLQSGWSDRAAVLLLYGLSLALSALALLTFQHR